MNDYDATVEQMFGGGIAEILEGMRQPLEARGYAVSIVIRRWAGMRYLPIAHDPLVLENQASLIMISASAIAAAEHRAFMQAFIRSPQKGDFSLPNATWVCNRTTEGAREMFGRIDRKKLLEAVIDELPRLGRMQSASPKGWTPRRSVR